MRVTAAPHQNIANISILRSNYKSESAEHNCVSLHGRDDMTRARFETSTSTITSEST